MALGEFVDEKKAQQLKDRSLPVEGCAVVAGRTDKGVSALHQVCSFCKLDENLVALAGVAILGVNSFFPCLLLAAVYLGSG